MRIEFDWDPAKAASNIVKHGVTFVDAMSVLHDPLALSILDGSSQEERWATLGLATTGKLLVVVHTWVDFGAESASVRIISARRPTRREARQYREGETP